MPNIPVTIHLRVGLENVDSSFHRGFDGIFPRKHLEIFLKEILPTCLLSLMADKARPSSHYVTVPVTSPICVDS